MKIVGLKAENFKKIRSIDIVIPEGKDVVEIVGGNGEGKSSFLDSVEAALGGNVPFEAVLRGKEECNIIVKLKDDKIGELTVSKVIRNGKKSTLVVKTNDTKQIFTSPQEVLDGFIGSLSFDPSSFYNMKDKDQYNVLKDMLGLEKIEKLDDDNKRDFESRTTINRELKVKEAQLAGVSGVDNDNLLKIVDVNKLVTKLQRINEQNNVIDIEFEKHRNIQNKLVEKGRRVRELEIELIKLRDEVIELKAEEILFKDIEKTDIKGIQREIKDAEKNNSDYYEQMSNLEKVNKLKEEIGGLSVMSEELTKTIEGRNDKKVKILSKIKMPIDGLNVENGIIRYNGITLKELSTAEQIRVSFGIAISLNPTLKVVFIRGGSLLDAKSKCMIIDLAREKGYDVWMELVESLNKDKGVMRVEIEDGLIV